MPTTLTISAGLEHATIKDNVLFGSAEGYNEARYHAVIEACALTRDLEVFDAGDMTGNEPIPIVIYIH